MRSIGGTVCSKSAQRSLYFREGLKFNRCASRLYVSSELRADFDQTSPPSLRECTPPNLGGECAVASRNTLPKKQVS